ncbi:MAG: universal stress protein [bacterium]
MYTILLPTDGSKPALEAESFLSRVYDASEDKVIVLSVVDMPVLMSGYVEAGDASGAMTAAELENDFKQLTQDRADDAAERLRTEGFDVETITAQGDVGTEICDRAEERDVDCIIMGRRGRGQVSEVLLGSVSHYVSHHAPCPVTLVTHEEE